MENKKKILVVDDDENLLTVLVDKLSASGFDVTGAVDGKDGLKKALELHPEAILLDVLMPKMNGWEMLDKLRADAWGKTVRVIILTSLDATPDVANALKRGIHEYLVKTSYNLDDVVKMLSETP